MLRRTDFLTAGALATAAPALATAAAAQDAATTGLGGYRFDRAAFESLLARPARHRQVYGTTKLASGRVFHYMRNALAAYRDGFGEGPGTLHVSAVMYGASLASLCPSSLWKTYGLTALLKSFGETFEHDTARPDGINPFASDVTALVADGATFFACNNALHDITESISSGPAGGGTSPNEVYAAFYAALRSQPGVVVVPAGVAALNAAQEARFTYVQATLS